MRFLTSLLLIAAAFAVSVSIPPSLESQHAAMHAVYASVGNDSKFCTAYAIGKHALATASHCWLGNKIKVDGKDASINFVLHDGEDHDLWLVTTEFADYVPLDIRKPVVGERVHLWGNPQGIRDQYREGYVMGFDKDGARDNILFDLHTLPGDSGSLIFGADSRVVGMTHAHIEFVHESYFFKFTPAQLQQAQEF